MVFSALVTDAPWGAERSQEQPNNTSPSWESLTCSCEKGKVARTQCPFMLWNKTNSEQLVANPTWEKNRLLNWAMPQILMILKYRCCNEKWKQGRKVRTLLSGSFILLTFEVLSAFIRLLLRCLISSARHCWQRLLCHPQHSPQLPELFEAEEKDIYNRVRPQVKTQGLNIVLPRVLFKVQTGVLWIDPQMLYK